MKTKILKLCSLHPQKYPDIFISCKVIDDMKEFVNDYITKLQQIGEFPKLAKKLLWLQQEKVK